MNGSEIRKAFLDFFRKNGHPVIKSAPLLPQGDTTLLFTSAGMVPFKPYFLGIKTDLSRAASCQKCFRTSDIDNVGRTARHLTFFEMLGNFSFGDYFKEESLAMGWDFLAGEMGLPADRLYFSYYGGGMAPGDEETALIWKKILPRNLHSRLFKLGDSDNFWTMGETGPCGPSSEIYYDRGEKYSHEGCKGPGCDCDRYVEIWNHVFTQFDRRADGTLKNLPRKNIDTGMGLERLAFLAEGRETAFETTLFYPVVESVARLTGREYSPDSKYVLNFRVISDHLRAAVFLAQEGILPSNEGRGYVLRRIIRRAERFARTMGAGEPVLHAAAEKVFQIFGGDYPELENAKKEILKTIKTEEEGFRETLKAGEPFLEEVMALAASSGIIPGNEVFKLYETYGFPPELTAEIAARNNLKIDEDGFKTAREKARKIARAAWKSSGEEDAGVFHGAEEGITPTKFVGYDILSFLVRVIAAVDPGGEAVDSLDEGEEAYFVFNETPFYAESGGQAADTGSLYDDDKNRLLAQVLDVKKTENGVFFHRIKAARGFSFKVKIDKFFAKVSPDRKKTAANHTAVHVVNAALKKVFGGEVRQAGSFVGPERFRFDYTKSGPPTEEEIRRVEDASNEAVREGYRVFPSLISLVDAKELGAVTLVGEKYADPARALLINKNGWKNPKEHFSLELCGGTHVPDLAYLGAVKILREHSVSKGIRRIEGVAGPALKDALSKNLDIVNSLSVKLSASPGDLAQRIDAILKEEKNLKGEIEKLRKKSLLAADAGSLSRQKLGEREMLFFDAGDCDVKTLRTVADNLRSKNGNSVIFAFSRNGGKISFVVSVPAAAAANASDIAKLAASLINGRGGGRRDFAQGGGAAPADIDGFRTKIIRALVEKRL